MTSCRIFSSVITREQYLRVMAVAKESPEEMYTILADEMPPGFRVWLGDQRLSAEAEG